MAGYAAYREISVVYSIKMSSRETSQAKLNAIQDEQHEALKKFVGMYPRVEDTPEAYHYLAVCAEFSGKDDKAKYWYGQISQNFPNHRLAETARGAVRRLDSVKQSMVLEGPRLNGGTYNISQSKNKVVAVYYWASYCEYCADELAKLKQVHATWAKKGFELVCVNLDDERTTAADFLAKHPMPAEIPILFQKGSGGGLTSPLATHYGINGLPTMFLVNKQGQVIDRTLRVGDLEGLLRRELE